MVGKFAVIGVLSWIYTCAPMVVRAQSAIDDECGPMLAILHSRLDEDLNHSDTWRMLGHVHHRLGNFVTAKDCYETALSLMPDNAAAHHDYGVLLNEGVLPDDIDNDDKALFHFERVVEIAPDSDYAQRLIREGFVAQNSTDADLQPVEEFAESDLHSNTLFIESESTEEAVAPVSYEVQTFDGSAQSNRRLQQIESELASEPAVKRLFMNVEFGVLYNSNVALAPISRELSNFGPASAQLFFNPDIEWTLRECDGWRMGPFARGYFSINESQLSSLDLASFQPGVFIERTNKEKNLYGRLDYSYSLDFFGGQQFGNQHSLTPSLTVVRSDHIDYLYAVVSTSAFDNDGQFPVFDSQDGETYSLGLMRFFYTNSWQIPEWDLGAELQTAATEGADFRYHSIRFFGDVTIQIQDRLSFIASGGVGYREYPDFTQAINRDEFNWRVAGQLNYEFNDLFSMAVVANYDRFASDNPSFDVDRLTTGISAKFKY